MDALQNAGITSTITVSWYYSVLCVEFCYFNCKVSNSLMVAQSVLQHEALYKISKLLDQLQLGLKDVGILDVIQAFPELFLKLFTFNGFIANADVLQALCIQDEDKGELVLFLYRYIEELTKLFLLIVYHNNYRY